MRHAPPVSVLCRGRGWRALQTGVAGLCAGVFGAWLAQHLGVDGFLHVSGAGTGAIAEVIAAVIAFATALPAAALAWRFAQAAPVTLRWDGQTWQADGHAVQLALMLDMGGTLLLRWQSAAGAKSHWTVVSAADAGPAWHALRTALHARPVAATNKPAPW